MGAESSCWMAIRNATREVAIPPSTAPECSARRRETSHGRRCFHVLWFQRLNHRPAPREPRVPHPIPLSQNQTHPPYLNQISRGFPGDAADGKEGRQRRSPSNVRPRVFVLIAFSSHNLSRFSRVLQPSSKHPGGASAISPETF